MKNALATWLPLLVAAALVGCSDSPELPLLPSASAKKPDQIDPNDLVEGPVSAFGLKFPIRSRIIQSTPDSKVLEVPYSMDQTTRYLGARLEPQHERKAEELVTFESSVIQGTEAGQRFDVMVKKTAQTTVVTVVRSTSKSDGEGDAPFRRERPPSRELAFPSGSSALPPGLASTLPSASPEPSAP